MPVFFVYGIIWPLLLHADVHLPHGTHGRMRRNHHRHFPTPGRYPITKELT